MAVSRLLFFSFIVVVAAAVDVDAAGGVLDTNGVRNPDAYNIWVNAFFIPHLVYGLTSLAT
jgi:hypothetical protein